MSKLKRKINDARLKLEQNFVPIGECRMNNLLAENTGIHILPNKDIVYMTCTYDEFTNNYIDRKYEYVSKDKAIELLIEYNKLDLLNLKRFELLKIHHEKGDNNK